jgi:tetratricopeptide (TPR) repeat protein
MKPALCAIFIIISLSLFSQAKTDPLQHARQFLDSEQYKPALGEVNQLIIGDSTNPDYYDFRADVYSKLKMFEEAKADYDKAIFLAPKEAVFYHHRSNLYMSVQEPGLAIDDNNTALKLAKNDVLKYVIILNRGECYRMKRDFQKAYEDFISVLKFDSTNLAALNNISNVLGDMERPKEATEYLQKVIRLYPNEIGGYANLAFQYIEDGEYAKAIELNNKVLQMDPKAAVAYNNRGFAKYKLDDLRGAIADINYSLQLYPDNSFAYKNRALVYIALKQYAKACEDLKMAVSLGFIAMYGDEVSKLFEKYCAHNN